MVGAWNGQLVKKDVGHARVVMLTGVDDHLGNVVAQGHLPRDRRGLDELRAGTDDGEKSHAMLFRFRMDLIRWKSTAWGSALATR